MPQPLLTNILPGLTLQHPSIVALNDQQYVKKKVRVSILRLDEIHPVVSGNKLFKLFYFLQQAKSSVHKTVITFGGAYSNHLAATAFACKEAGLKCIGIVRGEKPAVLSPTLEFCIENNMQLVFISRSSYKKKEEQAFAENLHKEYGDFTLVPEGGFSIAGAKGAALIPQFFMDEIYTHICLAVGTATTFAGIVNSIGEKSQIIGCSVLKGLKDINYRLEKLGVSPENKYTFIDGYDFGGYAKKTHELIDFINRFYDQHKIPLDFVYTGKMMFGVNDLIQKNFFPANANILCIHTGGLQGNQSLPQGTLHF